MKFIVLLLMIGMNVAYAIKPDDEAALKEFREALAPLDVKELARIITNETAKNLPQQVDSVSRVDAVSYIDNKITYRTAILVEELAKLAEVDQNMIHDSGFKELFLQEVKNIQVTSMCSSPNLYASLEKGLIFAHVYTLEDGKFYGSHEISIEECQ